MLLVFVVGVYFRSRESSSTKFLTHSSDLQSNRFIMMASIFSTAVGAGTIFGLTSKVADGQIACAFGLILSIAADLLVIAFLIPKIISFRKYSDIGSIVESIYGRIGKMIYGISVILVSLGYLSAQIKVSSHIFGHFTGISNFSGVLLSYMIVILYTAIGGLRSVILTDVVQFCFMIISIPYVAFYCIQTDQSFIFEQTQILISQDHNILYNTLMLAISFALMSINPPYLHRILISDKQAQSSSYIKTIIYLIFICIVVIIGLYIRHNFSSSDNQNLTLLIDEIIPIGFKGLVFCGILGALMSTADSNLHMASLSFLSDIFPIKASILLTRLFMFLAGIFSIFIALNFHNVIDLVIFMSGCWGAVIFVPLIFLFYKIYISKIGFICTTISGAASFIYSYIYYPIYFPSLIGASVNLLVFLLFKQFTINKSKL